MHSNGKNLSEGLLVNYVCKSKTVLFVGWRHPGIPQHLGSVYIINDLWTSTHASTSLATLLVYVFDTVLYYGKTSETTLAKGLTDVIFQFY